jgi:hypothetical protein
MKPISLALALGAGLLDKPTERRPQSVQGHGQT